MEEHERKDVPLAEVVNALGGEDVVVPLPRELGLDETLGRQALHRLDNLKVRHIELFMLGGVVVLLGDQHALCVCPSIKSERVRWCDMRTLEERLVDDAPVGLGNDHAGRTGVCGSEAGARRLDYRETMHVEPNRTHCETVVALSPATATGH